MDKREQVKKALDELHEINSVYSLPNETVEKLLSEIETAKVCIPIIGKFSSGKSALLNTVLGYSRKILKEDITPETAIPAEIVYSQDMDRITIVQNDGESFNLSVDEYREFEADANRARLARLNLRNHFLEEIPDVMLVDMPGFESGFEVHNRAIDNYLPRSLAYIIAIPADDMIVRSSVGSILKELCLHDMPICIAVTKYDKRNEEFEETFTAMKESLKRFIGNREVTYCLTSSFSGDAKELEQFLKDIQKSAQELLANQFKTAVLSAVDATENYLRTTLKSSELSASELDGQEELLGRQMDSLTKQFSKEKDNFELQISECVDEIKADVQRALEAEESSFVAMAMNNQNINERLNTVVRGAVTVSVKNRFLPKVEKYLKRVTNCINGETVGDFHLSLYFNTEDVSKGIVSTTVAAVAAIVFAGPLIGGIIAALIAFVNKMKNDKKREETKNQIRMKLKTEVFPQVLKEVGNGVETAITKQLKLINTSIEEEVAAQRTALEKAIEDVRRKMADEKERKENLEIDITADLDRIQAIRNEI